MSSFIFKIGNALARTEKGYHMPVTLTDYYYSLKDPKSKLAASRETQIHRFIKSDLEQVTETSLRRRKHMLEKRRSSRSSIYNYRRGVSMMLRYI